MAARMAERAFFGPAQYKKENVTAQKELNLYFAESDQLQQRPSFHAVEASSSSHAYASASPAYTYPSSSLSHDAGPSSHRACSSVSREAYRREHQHSYDYHEHELTHEDHHHYHRRRHHEYAHLIDELRTCAKLKAEIVAHPLFDDLLQAHVQCLSVGIPIHHVQAMEAQLANRHSIIIKYLMVGKNVDDQGDPLITLGSRREIDVFMENYLQLLLSWRKQLEDLVIPPTIKALATLCEIEQAFCDLTGLSSNGISRGMERDEDCEDTCLDPELPGGDYGIESPSDIDHSLLEQVRMELKSKLKEGYRESLQAMRDEIMRKRQAGKLPGDISALKKWWSAHSRWPYPTEEDKRKLMEETGLEMRQINNWFINHRKRNWTDRQPPPPPTSNATSAGSSSLQG